MRFIDNDGTVFEGRSAFDVVLAMRAGAHDPAANVNTYMSQVAERAGIFDPNGDPGLLLMGLENAGVLRRAPEEAAG